MTDQADCPHRDFFQANNDYVCHVCGKKLAPVGWARITDANGTRWVAPTPRKRRKAGRAVRFAEIKVGEELIWGRSLAYAERWAEGPITAAHLIRYVVTDLWFDPVAGQRDDTAGQMVAIKALRDGEPVGQKIPHTRRGLAMQGYHYAATYLEKKRQSDQSIIDQIEAIRRSAGA